MYLYKLNLSLLCFMTLDQYFILIIFGLFVKVQQFVCVCVCVGGGESSYI